MLKKIITYVIFLIFLFSCDAQIAKSQFENGQYRESVKTTVKIAGSGKYTSLKENEKLELINRIRHIDNYYSNLEDSSNIQDIYDAFAIGYMINSKIEGLSPQLNYLSDRRVDNLSIRLERIVKNILNSSYTNRDLNTISNIRVDMKEIGLLNSKYQRTYRNISQKLADTYYSLANNANYDETELEYLKLAYKAFSDFDDNYRNIKSRYLKLEKEIDIRKATDFTNSGKRNYYIGNYEEALDQFEKAKEIYGKYSEYSFEIRDINEYINNIKVKMNEKTAQEYYEKGLYLKSRKDYLNAAKAFYNAHKLIPNYKGSYKLAKECEELNKSTRKYKYYLNTNSDNRSSFIKNELARYGYESSSYYTKDFTINYRENVEYEAKLNGEILRVKIEFYSNDLNFYGTRTIEKVDHTFNPTSKANMLRKYNREINEEISELIRKFSNR